MTDCKEVKSCRVCGGPLREVLDLGTQRLAGVFPAAGEPDPPAFPLVLCHCQDGCGLVQLGHTVRPGLMFNEGYGYRSGVTSTMRAHLKGMAEEAIELLGEYPGKVLDVGGNNGTLLRHFEKSERSLIDPTGLSESPGIHCVRDFYPSSALKGMKFDLVFTVACFYDADDPVDFARAARDNLAGGGLWCVEVADCNAMLGRGLFDQVCHEHLTYFTFSSLRNVLARAGLRERRRGTNDCNGASLRLYAQRDERRHTHDWQDEVSHNLELMSRFRAAVNDSAQRLRDYLHRCQEDGLKVHLLGASTKANTVLQYCGVTPDLVELASDRDPRKRGRRTPGAGIPVVSEEESRALKPDVYVCLLHGFRDEVVAREKDFLARGGRLCFPLPAFEEVRGG